MVISSGLSSNSQIYILTVSNSVLNVSTELLISVTICFTFGSYIISKSIFLPCCSIFILYYFYPFLKSHFKHIFFMVYLRIFFLVLSVLLVFLYIYIFVVIFADSTAWHLFSHIIYFILS